MAGELETAEQDGQSEQADKDAATLEEAKDLILREAQLRSIGRGLQAEDSSLAGGSLMAAAMC